MGIKKQEVFKNLQKFISENQNNNDENFIHNLKLFIKYLTNFINQHDSSYLIINTDGSSKGNPGKARIGIQFKDSTNKIVLQKSQDIGIKTNNEAEYIAIWEALKLALKDKHKKIHLYSDSQLVVNQLNNLYKIKVEGLRKFYDEIKKLQSQFEEVKFIHISRNLNKQADILSK